MKKYYGNYLGMVIDNNDPEFRGRVQIFIPHIMPALYEGWNNLGKNITINCVGDNMPQGLTTEIIDRLKKILPWAESASPIVGQSASGGVVPQPPNQVCGNVSSAAPGAAPSATTSTNGSSGASGGNVGGDGNTELNVDKLPPGLKPLAADFTAAGKKYNVDPNFLAAIAWNETEGGTSKAFRQGNNAMGISDAKGPIYGYSSYADNIDKQARSITRSDGYYKNCTTIRSVGEVYSPTKGATNDPLKRNGDWVPTVGAKYKQLTGKDPNSTVLNLGKGNPSTSTPSASGTPITSGPNAGSTPSGGVCAVGCPTGGSQHLDQTPTAVPPGSLPPGTALEIPLAHSDVDVKNLKPIFVQRLNGFYREAKQLGYTISCTSGWRSYEKQLKLYQDMLTRNGLPKWVPGTPMPRGDGSVARPGGSSHERGLAVDIKVSGNGVVIQTIIMKLDRTANHDTPAYRALLAKYNLHQPLHPELVNTTVPEKWHVEPIEMPKAGGDRSQTKMAEIAALMSNTKTPPVSETTSSSQMPPAGNPLETKTPSDSNKRQAISPTTNQTSIPIPTTGSAAPGGTLTSSSPLSASAGKTITTGATTVTATTSATSSNTGSTNASGTSKLAADRTAYFQKELGDTQLLDRLEYLFFHQESTTKNVDCGSIIFETAVNRAFFKGLTLKKIVFTAAYYAHDGTSMRPHTNLTMEMIKRVIYNGQNHTNLATDNASNVAGSDVAGKRVRAGCSGSWFDLKTGQKITDPGLISRLTSINDGQKEFLYRADGRNGYTSDAGTRAATYAKQNNIQPTSPSTFNSDKPVPPEIQNASKSSLTGNPLNLGAANSPSLVNNTDPHGPTVVKNTNDSAKGMFTFPGVGAMVWTFFREGNPQFPVYFAASYSSSEWKSAYHGASLNPEGTNNGTVGTQVANSLKMNPNAGGGLEFTHVKDTKDPSGASDKAVAMMYGDDGSNMLFSKGYHQLYTRHDRRDQTDGHYYKIIGGAEEKWIEDDSNLNVIGNAVIKIGKVNGEAVEAMKELADFSKQMNDMLMSKPSK